MRDKDCDERRCVRMSHAPAGPRGARPEVRRCARAGNRLRWAVTVAACAGAMFGQAESGFYISGQLGGHARLEFRLQGGDTDRAARCDEFVNPRYAEVPACTTPNRGVGAVDDWMSVFDGGAGFDGGLAIGVERARLRLELEFVHGVTVVDQSASILSPQGRPFTAVFGSELPQAQERLGRLRSRQVFINGYWSFPNATRFTPFVGVGVGVANARMGYRAVWRRSDDPGTVRTAAGLPNEAEVKHNLAGTVSRAEDVLGDKLRGHQLLLGIEYRLRERWTLAAVGRWTRFGAFEASGVYDQLRDHASNLRRDGSEPVTYRVRTADTSRFAFGVRVSRRF